MSIDLHTHTFKCHHAKGTSEDIVKAAIQQGLKAIGINDHFPMRYLPAPIPAADYAMELSEFPDHVKEIKQLREKYKGKIEVLFGSEVDFYQPAIDTIKQSLEPFMDDFDYLYGSVHVVTDWTIDDEKFMYKWEEQPIDNVHDGYYRVLEQMAKTRLFDVVGHIDVCKKFKKFPSGNLDTRIGTTLDAIAAAGMVLEINTAGLRKPVGEIYPSPRILEMAAARNIKITLGSDAHDPAEVGYCFDKAIDLAKRAGYASLVTFKKRQPSIVGL
ncbi:MAG: histidinol-phosphatase HisJ [Candidatus Lokiarchaeota archaeon]|nr:histidinol-phosphatase HisJ [Candidatus Lokiarchaeota archaeon]